MARWPHQFKFRNHFRGSLTDSGRGTDSGGTHVHTPRAAPHGRFLDFVVNHEDRWLFVVLYVGLAVILSVFLTLFWLVLLLMVHLAFEIIHETAAGKGARTAFRAAAWAVKLDVALVLFAFALSLYMDQVLGLLGLRAAAQVGTATRVGARAAAWSRGIRAVLLTADDAAQVVRAATRGRKKVASAHDPRKQGWGMEDWISVVLGGGCLVLILAAPAFLGGTYSDVAASILRELRPVP